MRLSGFFFDNSLTGGLIMSLYKADSYTLTEHGQLIGYSPFPMASIVSIKNCLCDDGVRRFARITGEPDSFFSIPARVKAKGKTVSGYATMDNGEWLFHATGKNRGVIERHKCECDGAYCGCPNGSYGPSDAKVCMLATRQALCLYCYENKMEVRHDFCKKG
jgi:hypothetical protein